MSSDTKAKIIDSFIRLADKMPFRKMTVKNIVQDCGINRATFYYHFSDIYGIIEYLCDSEAKRISSPDFTYDSTINGFLKASETILENKRAFLNICNALGRDKVEEYLRRPINSMLEKMFVSSSDGIEISRNSLDFLITFYSHAVIGLLYDWLTSDEMPDEKVLYNGVDTMIKSGMRALLEAFSENK